MLQQSEEQSVLLTPAAARAARDIFAQRKLEGYALRVFVAGQGCCGPQYGLALEKDIRATDLTFETDGVKVVVDNISMESLRGASIDFVNDPQRGTGFLVSSPIAQEARNDCSSGCSSCGD